MILHGNAAAVVQVLTLIVTAERLAVYAIRAYKNKGTK